MVRPSTLLVLSLLKLHFGMSHRSHIMRSLQTSVCTLLGCDVPIVLAGMGGPARAELVAAVSNAGGYGFLGMVRESPELIAREIAAVRAHTSRPFGVNLIPAATHRELLEAELAACLEANIAAVTLFWELMPNIVQRLRNAGVTVLCQIGSATEAEAAQAAGANLLIAQGCEAGGHVRGRQPLHTLLPEVLAVATVPVLAAGGLTNGADLAWAITSGAAGIMMGTAFLATHESFAHDYHKQCIVEAAADSTLLTDIFHINWPRGAAVRVLQNSVTRGERGDSFDPAANHVIAYDDGRPIPLFSTDSPLRTTTGDLEAMALYAGTGAADIDRIQSAAELIDAVTTQASALLQQDTESASTPSASSSPVCYADEADASYAGMADRAELQAALEELLQAERAGARVAGHSALATSEGHVNALLTQVQRDEARWCAMLMTALRRLDASPSGNVGAFYDKAMAIDNIDERLALLNRGQGWVVRKLQNLIPRVSQDWLRDDLVAMRKTHEDNIHKTELLLAGRKKI
jgi:nitronate monooxygenase